MSRGVRAVRGDSSFQVQPLQEETPSEWRIALKTTSPVKQICRREVQTLTVSLKNTDWRVSEGPLSHRGG